MGCAWQDWMVERLAELRAQTAAGRTYGDWWELADDLRDELEHIRKSIASDRSKLRRLRHKALRFQGWSGSYWAGAVERMESRIAAECAFRDELAEGLREMKRQDRENLRAIKRLRTEMEARG